MRQAAERAQTEAAAAAEAERQRQEREAALQRQAQQRARLEAQLKEEADQRALLEAQLKQEAEERTRLQAAAAEAERARRQAEAAAAAAEGARLEREAALKREAEQRARQEAAAAVAAERQRLQQQAALTADADERSRRDVERQLRITRFVNNYDGGECFFVAATLVAENRATLDGLGSSVAPFEALDSEFKRINGFEANIGVHQVTRDQCAAVNFLSQLKNEPGLPPRLDIGATAVKSGAALTGTVAEFGDRTVALVLVTDNGNVLNLTSGLKPDGDSLSFALNPLSDDMTAGQPQLLLAIVSNAPLGALKNDRTGPAAQAFARALKEARDTGQTVNVSPKYFKLEK
jgi:serine/threonine-protein kinase